MFALNTNSTATVYPFSKIPAFGFETKSIHAAEKAAALVDNFINKLKNGSNFERLALSAAVDKTGSEEALKALLTQNAYKENNAAKILGYIPGLGTAQGIQRIVKATRHKDIFGKREYARAVVESLSLGIFLLPVDLAITTHRNKKWNKMQIIR